MAGVSSKKVLSLWTLQYSLSHHTPRSWEAGGNQAAEEHLKISIQHTP